MDAHAALQVRKPGAPGIGMLHPGVLQRKCGCGKHTSGGECSECRKNRPSHAGVADRGMASGLLAAAASRIDAAARSNRAGFAADFSGVPLGARHGGLGLPARLGAEPAGFAAAERRWPNAPGGGLGGGTLPYREATELLECVRIMGAGSAEYCREEVLGERPAAKAPACDAAKQSEKWKACIQPVVIADDDGKNPTSAPSFVESQAIWRKCCVELSVNGAQTIKKSAYKTLDESKDNTPTDEEKDLFKDAGKSKCIQVFVPTEFGQDGNTGKGISGGGGTYDAGAADPKIVVVEGAVGEVVAHEVGHAMGYRGHDGDETVMKPTGKHDVANKSAVSKDVCTRAKSGAALTKSGAEKGCCLDI